jgi:L1 cell adhesion molecule like protein
LLGTFNLTGIQRAPRGVPQIEVTFDVDVDGILSVAAKDKTTGSARAMTINNEKGRLSQREIEKMIEDAEEFRRMDEEAALRVEARIALEEYCFAVRSAVGQEALEPGKREAVERAVGETLEWMEVNKGMDVAVIRARQRELREMLASITPSACQAAAAAAVHVGVGASASSGGDGGRRGPQIEDVD